MADSKPCARAIPRIQKIWNLHSAIPLRVNVASYVSTDRLKGKTSCQLDKGGFPTVRSISSAASAEALLLSQSTS